MTDVIERLRELEQEATEGPWEHVSVEGGWSGVESPNGVVFHVSLNHPPNATFAAAARIALPLLLDIAEATQAILDAPSFEAFAIAGVDGAPLKAAAEALDRLEALEAKQ